MRPEALFLPSCRRALRAALAAAWLGAFLSFAVPAAAEAAKQDAADMDAAGYRIGNYRSPVTLPIEGGKQISLAEFDRLLKENAVLVDVMPARAGFDANTGKWRVVDKRDDIPSSTWLPNTGQGHLDPRLATYFSSQLQHLTAGNLDRPLIFYCMADCWMSWNAVKRAASLGYRQVHWYAEGTDGWTEAGRSLVKAEPPPVPPLSDTH